MSNSSLATGLQNKKGYAFLSLLVLVSLFAWRPLRALSNAVILHEQNSHILLVLPIVLTLLVLDTRGRVICVQWSIVRGLIVLLLALVLAGISTLYEQKLGPSNALSLSILSWVTAWYGLTILFYGTELFRSLTFPLAFLVLLVPIPDFVLSKIIWWLQYGSTVATQSLFVVTGVPVAREGFVLLLPTVDIEVAPECSGIRSTMMLVLTTLVLGRLFLRTARSQCLLFLSVVLIAVIKNALRIFTLSMLAMYVDPTWLEGEFHHRYGGSVFFALAILMIMGVLRLLRRSEQGPPFLTTAATARRDAKAV